jgi:hypothetical protein
MRPFVWLLALSVAAGTLLAPAGGAGAQLLITGNDEKISFDETGKTVTHPPGKDTVSIIDIREPTKPRIVANLPLMNTITGPPVNLAITPDQHLALVANSLDWVKDGESWKGVPDSRVSRRRHCEAFYRRTWRDHRTILLGVVGAMRAAGELAVV